MPLDPSIPLRARGPVAPVNPLELAGQTYQLRDLAMKSQAMQRAQSREQTIADLYRTNVGADGTINAPGMTQGLAQSGYGDAIPGFTKQQAEAGKATTDQQASSLALHQQKLKIINSTLGALAMDPDLNHDKVIAAISQLVNQGVATADEGAQAVRDLPGPKSLRAHIIAQAAKSLDAEKQLAMSLPKYDEQDRGGAINEGTIDPATGIRTAGPDIQKTMAPRDVALANRVEAGKFGPEEADLLGAIAERGISLPAGLRSKEQQIATLRSLVARNPGKTSEEIADALATGQLQFGVDRKATTVAAAAAGKVALGLNEIKEFAPQVLEASAKVARGSFLPYTKLAQMSDAQLNDPNLRDMKLTIQALLNAYDQVAARAGTDVGKREEAHKMLTSADSPEVLARAVERFGIEAEAAERAAQKATQAPSRLGPPRPTGAPTQTSGGTPSAAEVQAFVDKGYPPDVAAIMAKHQ